MTTSRICSLALAASMVLFAGCNSAPTTPQAAPAPAAVAAKTTPEAPAITSETEPKHAWTKEQILTCTVSQCWQLSDRNEDKFFDIVQQLAVISANDRGLNLPDNEAAGQKVGEDIKAQTKADHQQLLYAVVDAAVRKVGTPATTASN